MPRRSRVDAPEAIHHIIARGIERTRIFRDEFDRNNFLHSVKRGEELGNARGYRLLETMKLEK